MSLRLDDFEFVLIKDSEFFEIQFNLDSYDMMINILAYNTHLNLFCHSWHDTLSELLEAVIDIMPVYAQKDKYFLELRHRSRVQIWFENKGLLVIDLVRGNYIKLLIRLNPDTEEENDSYYYSETGRDEDYIKAVKGEVLLAIDITADKLVAALINGVEQIELNYGRARYKSCTRHTFPEGLLQKLQAIAPLSNGYSLKKVIK